MRWFALPSELRRAGVLSMNARNALYIARRNPRRLYPRVDDKLLTKQLALDAGLAVPELYGVVSSYHDARGFERLLEGREDFVIKPACGAGGDGIVVVSGRLGDGYLKINGTRMMREDIVYHLGNILSGMYSFGGRPDRAMIEYRVKPDAVFNTISHLGVPDVRVIVHRGFPVLAMLRLPTRNSGGKANLHQGAVGTGIDIASGRTTHGVWHGQPVDRHPDSMEPLEGVAISGWDRILELSAGGFELTGLGYLGVDIVIDRDRGPLILELNARPGLAIQVANRRGLRERLEIVDRDADTSLGASERAAYVRNAFAQPMPSAPDPGADQA
ncbi:alpha-L-glutamate ligase-like protein [Marilutibacter spongiae]|uniref:Alpha-L-glutamate ligase-like protein n=1 Tax=Marilutibacter spongiae TaxID=2025720 RepID=A0A7W3TJ99_9GAMM|nr:alpha-L-glutamate ligase-like protein [Lysobacter spongiae]MBB1058984.1 alpha-L-glutamate ligase-like protein [Lysobacter spongiae]